MLKPNPDLKKNVKKDTDFISNWYKNRKKILNENNELIDLPNFSNLDYNPVVKTKQFGKPSTRGEFDPKTKEIGLAEDYDKNNMTGILGHEMSHFLTNQMHPDDVEKYIYNPTVENYGQNIKDFQKNTSENSNYLLEPEEVNSRLMQFRMENDYKPEEIIDQERLNNSTGKDKFLLDMFDNGQMLNLLNKTVNTDVKNSDVQIAAFGGKITKPTTNNNMKKTKGLKKYGFGNMIENPMVAIAENNIALAKAGQKTENGLTKGLDIFGSLAMKAGSALMKKGIANGEGADGEGIAGFLAKNSGLVESGANILGSFGRSSFAMGGNVPGVPVEVEGQEVGQMPNGNMMEFEGPSHEQGGIPIALPEGTEIYSKRIKVDGVSMADRKKKREKKTMTLESLFEKNKTDALIKNSLSKTLQNNDVEEGQDNKIQNVVKQLLETQENLSLTKHLAGGKVKPLQEEMDSVLNLKNRSYFDRDINPLQYEMDSVLNLKNNAPKDLIQESLDVTGKSYVDGTQNNKDSSKNSFLKNMIGDVSIGDATSLLGSLVSTFDPMKNTKENRAGDTPNINAFKNYGQEGLKTLEDSKKYINQIRDEKLGDLDLTRTGSIKRNSNSSRSVNVNRALNLATDANINEAKENTYNSFAESMMGVLNQEAGMKNQKDQMVMQGEQDRDLSDRKDRDNYYSQMAKNIATKGEGLQDIGGDLNKMKESKEMKTLINQLSQYGYIIKDGKVILDPEKTDKKTEVKNDNKKVASKKTNN